jgi:hypothetical protein
MQRRRRILKRKRISVRELSTLFADTLYDLEERLEETSFNFDYDDQTAPHFAWPILSDTNYFEFDPLARSEQFTTQARRADLTSIRDALAALRPGSAHQASVAPDPNIIFAPTTHANALDPERALVIGNRGVGKSFWSAVLVNSLTRRKIAEVFPRLRLDRVEAVLGFHEDAGKDEGPSPSPAILQNLMSLAAKEPEQIWRAVLLKALEPRLKVKLPASLRDIVAWASDNIEQAEAVLRDADRYFLGAGRTFLIIFDALDRLGRDWNSISVLSEGILRFALDVRGFRAIRAKIFMRTDQANDDSLFRFADASKIRADSVKLVWQRIELFGLLYNELLAEEEARRALLNIAGEVARGDLVERLLNETKFQERVFYEVAGEYMGAGAKRGRTYSWLYDHLADAFGETSPRSFLTALERAANHGPAPVDTAIDHYGIRAGVQDASEVRVTQLKEDYDWIDSVLRPLEGLEVPCDPTVFKKRWRERRTVPEVTVNSQRSHKLLPLELERGRSDPEGSLLSALRNIGVVEFRAENRINMPDIFRVAARIKRRGGVRPPESKRRG